MEKIIKINGCDVAFKSTGAFLLRYKMQFNRDAVQDMYKLEKAVDSETGEVHVEQIDLEIFYNLIWTLAKTADQSIEPPFEWLDSFESFPLEDILPELKDMLISCFKSTASYPSKKK